MNYKCIIVVGALFLLSSCTKQEEQPKGQLITQKEEPKTGEVLIGEAKDKLIEAKAKLAQEGKYGCCLKEPCNMCALDEAKCNCYEDLKKHEGVCMECYAGWQHGKGADEKIRKENVKPELMEDHD